MVQVQPLLRFDSAAVRRRHTDDVYDFAHSTRAVAYAQNIVKCQFDDSIEAGRVRR